MKSVAGLLAAFYVTELTAVQTQSDPQATVTQGALISLGSRALPCHDWT